MKRILAVDDSEMNLRLVENIIKKDYQPVLVQSGAEAISYLKENTVDLILLDLIMPEMDGIETYDQLRGLENGRDVPVIFLTADTESESEIVCLKKGAADFVRKPFLPEVVQNRIRRVLELDELTRCLERKVMEKTAQIEKMTFETIATISSMIEAKDSYTKGHSVRVAEYSAGIAECAGWSESAIQNLRYIALLHDIGKVGVPDNVLNKPGKLTDEEFGVIKSHTNIGGDILKEIKSIPEVEAGAKYHHERYEGTGYPCGLAGDEIPAVARIIGIADAFDAMNSKRVYRDSLSPERIREELVNGRGTQFDPNFLDIFLKLFDEGKLTVKENVIAEPKTVSEESNFLMNRIPKNLEEKARRKEAPDYLTGLMNRHAGEAKIVQAMREMPGCLAFVDLDNLKTTNDTMGHLAGDFALKTVAEVLKQHQENGIAVRLGGDEFLYYMIGVTKEAAEQRVAELQKAFDEKKKQETMLAVSSISMGLCMCTPTDVYGDVLQKADKALYHVKHSGKGNFSFYEKKEGQKIQDATLDLRKLQGNLRDQGAYSGSLRVSYRDFARMYDFIRHLGDRFEYDIQLLVLSMDIKNYEEIYLDETETAMMYLEKAIQDSLRSVDVSTRFGSNQFLVALLNAQETDIECITRRIFEMFYDVYDKSSIELTYDFIGVEG
ncbi:MAG: diguanylate cyclase [Lachnospiraceae bacterium]|nr:diguanylate cyclase [Lachnospiraceae bacterium]